MTARILRRLIPALALAVTAASTASADPLAGTGENVQPIARVPIANVNEVELAGDWAFVSSDQYGLVIVNIADPSKPFVEGKWDCEGGGWGDVDISPDSNITVLTQAHAGECFEEKTAVAILDTSDKKHPKLLSTIAYNPDIAYVHTSTMDRNLLYLNPQAAAFYQQDNPHIPIYDISNPAKPEPRGFIAGRGIGLGHDTYVDHRPDGKSLMYAASIHQTDIFDVTDPFAATLLQQVASPEITISHDVQPNWKRDVIVVDDEGAAGGQLNESVSACGKVGGPGPAAYDSGSVHFYGAAADGTFANAGAVELGSWNAPANANTGACVAHVFWQAPDQNRLTQAYYRTGAFILDFEDPANVTMLGSFVADGGANYWSFKPHRGYIFGSDQDHGLDIVRYTGEGGSKWPATAGPAEIQRYGRHGLPYKPITLGGSAVSTGPLPAPPATDTRAIGKFAFTAKIKKTIQGKKGKKVALKVVFTDANGKTVGQAKVTKAAGKKATVKVSGGAVVGTYKWVVKAGKKTLDKGRFTVKKTAGWTLSPGATLAATAR